MVPGVLCLVSLAGFMGSVVTVARSQCPEEYSQVDTVKGRTQLPKWPQTSSQMEIYSEPLCLSKELQVVSRECSGSWRPNRAPTCSHTSPKNPIFYCPPGYHVVTSGDNHVCVTLSNEKWLDTCRFSTKALDLGEDILHAIIQHLKSLGVYTAWLPVKRLDHFGPLLWMIPGPKWGSRFAIPHGVEIIYGNRRKDCLVLDVLSGAKIKAEVCEAVHPYLCVVEESYFPKGGCPPRYVASPIPSDKRCFRLMRGQDMTWKDAMERCASAQINSPLIGQLFTGLARRGGLKEDIFCWIGGDGRYRSNTMALNSRGDLTNLNSTASLLCVFCEIYTPQYPETSISLRFYPDQRQLLLNVYGEEGLWKESYTDPGIRCFSNADGDFIRSVKLMKIWDRRWTTEDIEPDVDFQDRVNLRFDTHKTTYRVEVSDSGPGIYICEGHTVGGEPVKSQHVIAYKELEGHTFALTLDIMDVCENVENCDPTFLDIYEKLAEDLQKAATDHLVKDIRTMEILEISPDGDVTVLFHVTATNLDEDEPVGIFSPNAYVRTRRMFQLLVAMYPKVYGFRFLRSCDGCPSSTTGEGGDRLIWPFTSVGMNAASSDICVDSAGLPVYRTCEGNYMHGGSWAEPSGECVIDIAPESKELYRISKNMRSSGSYFNREVANTVLEIVENVEELTAADIYYLSMIMEYEAKIDNTTEVLLEDVSRLSYILDRVMRTNRSILKKSQTLNSTDVLLDSLSTMLDFASINIDSESLSQENGLITIVMSQLIIQISDPNTTNITGLALLRDSSNRSESDGFRDYKIVPLYAEQAIKDVVNLGDVEVATWIPRNLLDSMLTSNTTSYNTSWQNVTINGSPRIVVTLFYNDVVFNNEFVGKETTVNSRVVSVSVPGYGRYLPIPIPILFKPLEGTVEETETCAFWDFDYVGISPSASHSAWSEEGCDNAGRTRDVSGELNICLCSHLTHFAQLVLGYFPNKEMKNTSVSSHHEEALEVITVVGCVLSMVGVFGILITAFVFKSWRKKPGTKVLIQLSFALGLEKFVIGTLPFVDSSTDPIPCIIVGATLHYSILAEFSWMLVTALLQFKRYVTVLGVTRPPRFLLKSAAFAWGVPFLIVAIVLSIDHSAYLPPGDSNRRFCQVSGLAQYIGLLVPVFIVVVLNAILFVRVIHSIVKSTRSGPRVEDDTTLVVAQVRLGVMLFFLLGITWVFGLVAKMGAGLIFSYLFCITAALQGFVLFFFFIVCDPATRKLWYSVIRMNYTFSKKNGPNLSASIETNGNSTRY